jgi:hypothetical protein
MASTCASESGKFVVGPSVKLAPALTTVPSTFAHSSCRSSAGAFEGSVANRLGNHMQLQPVIDIAPDGSSAKIRIRMFQQMSFGPRASVGAAVYENTAVAGGR